VIYVEMCIFSGARGKGRERERGKSSRAPGEGKVPFFDFAAIFTRIEKRQKKTFSLFI